jgi:3-deoxy-D-manno-octulosonic-acid transferase
MLLKLYSFLTTTIRPALRLHLRSRLKKGKELKARLPERYGKTKKARPVGPLVWIHVASLGEAQSTVPLVQQLQKFYPHITILLTYGTVTAARIMEKRFNASVIQQFVPLDVPKWINRFLNHWQPSLGIWIESELWPNLIHQTRKRKIPLVLLNAKLSLRSFKKWKRIPKFSRELVSAFDICLAQTEEMANRYKALGAPKVATIGNFKAAADPLHYDPKLLDKLKESIGNRPFWLAASTHPGEDEIILAAHQKIAQEFPDIVTLIAPRHINRSDHIQTLIENQKLNFALRSQGEWPGAETNVYLVDTMGELGGFFKATEIVFVAGSLSRGIKQVGGHNPLEPALLDCAIAFGPDMSNIRDIADGLLKRGAAQEVATSKELANFVAQNLKEPSIAKEMAEKAHFYAETQKEVLCRVMDYIVPYLENLGSKPKMGQKTGL